MKKLTKQEIEQQPMLGRGGRSPLFRALLNLEVGEGLELAPDEWDKSYPPTRISTAISKKYKRTYAGGRHGKTGGWLFQRLS